MDRDPVLIGGAEGFPIELVLLFFIMLGIIGLVYWLSRALGQREGEKDREARREAIAAEASARSPGLLHLERGAEGAWLIYVKGKRYPTLDAVPDPEAREEVVAAMRELVLFARDYVKKRPDSKGKRKKETTAPVQKPPTPPAKPKQAPPPSPTPAEPTSAPPPTPQPTSAARQPGQLAPEQAAEALRRLEALKARSKRRAEDRQPQLSATPDLSSMMPRIDLAREIGAIVDEMQAQAPQLQERSIRLHNTASGGIQFAIDGIVYEDVNDIPSDLVRKLIKAATREWERR